MNDLTLAWKTQKLPLGWYYIKFEDGSIDMQHYIGGFLMSIDNRVTEVLAEVPSYEEYLTMKDCVKAEFEAVVKMTQAQMDCKILAQKLLQVKPELKGWLEINFKGYL